MTSRRTLAATTVLVLLALPAVHARWAQPTLAPVDRLLRNAELYVQEVPQDPHGFYVLGRAHTFVFAHEARNVAIWPLRHDERRYWGALPQGGTPDAFDDWPTAPVVAQLAFQQGFRGQRVVDTPQPPDALPEHLSLALVHLGRALALDNEPAIHHLARAYALETGCRFAAAAPEPFDLLDVAEPRLEAERRQELSTLVDQLGSRDDEARARAASELTGALDEAVGLLVERREDPERAESVAELLTLWWRELALRSYHQAHVRALDVELEADVVPHADRELGLGSFVAWEAGQAYLRLVAERGVRDEREQELVDGVTDHLAHLEALPEPSHVTPIVFALDAARPLADLLLPGCSVTFDLDGDGTSEAWPWIAPQTGCLVWDPYATGVITSGRQLFGTATWWMLFRDGYAALSALDDDRDGLVAGPELHGLGVWSDRNTDGVSDPGEVVPVTAVGIVALSTEVTGTSGDSLVSAQGLHLSDGRRLPTYDWVTRPAGTPRD